MRLEADPILQELQMKISNTLKRSANVSFEQVWSELVDLGIPAYSVPVSADGYDLGMLVNVMVCEELGKVLFNHLFIDTMIAVDSISLSHDGKQKDFHWEKLRKIAHGKLLIGTVERLGRINSVGSSCLMRSAGGWTINGSLGFTTTCKKMIQELILPLEYEGANMLVIIPVGEEIKFVPYKM
ncbi:acyl-CoA dehydrogenase family protein [Brevibacillus borstelensis]|uniref:acyl-CoA dehydrogenase family protein n=1 Tax=Brevibacillus borstelensis TaxID=45462 RepID=UPI002E1F7A9D|nr:acyl-CoA dehydrogenase family protein [Brevibacillus borstelensis]MED1876338.1 acyl-CoA dehydrogenase family protein [Brevibacillus borstelensis]